MMIGVEMTESDRKVLVWDRRWGYIFFGMIVAMAALIDLTYLLL